MGIFGSLGFLRRLSGDFPSDITAGLGVWGLSGGSWKIMSMIPEADVGAMLGPYTGLLHCCLLLRARGFPENHGLFRGLRSGLIVHARCTYGDT